MFKPNILFKIERFKLVFTMGLMLSIFTRCFSQPQIKVDHEFVDLGVLPMNTAISYKIAISNIGNAPLIIKAAKANAGSDVASWPMHPILPNESDTIVFRIKTGNYSGDVHRSVSVISNAKIKIIRVKYSIAKDLGESTNCTLELLKIAKDSIQLNLNGHYLTTGECQNPPPILNVEKLENDGWTEHFTFRHGIVSCGPPIVACINKVYGFNINKVSIPFEILKLNSGTYRFWATTEENKVIYSNSIVLAN